MIIAIESELPSFKPIRLKPGLNVLLADKSPSSGEKQTRNSAGKSSLVDVINFLLGGKAASAVACHDSLKAYTFYGTFSFDGDEIRVGRSGDDPSKILVDEEKATAFGLTPKWDKKTGRHFVSNETWKEFLGNRRFALPFPTKGTAFEQSYTPSFRSMIAYFVRRRGGFMRPDKHAEKQATWDSQVNLSYLLGLDWTIPFEIEKVRQRERQLVELKNAAQGGVVGDIIGTVAELRPRVVLAEANVEKLRGDLAAFRVVDSYREMSDRASALRGEMLAIERNSVILKQTLDHLEANYRDEQPPATTDVDRLYKAVGIELPTVAVRRFQEVSFRSHARITAWRSRSSDTPGSSPDLPFIMLLPSKSRDPGRRSGAGGRNGIRRAACGGLHPKGWNGCGRPAAGRLAGRRGPPKSRDARSPPGQTDQSLRRAKARHLIRAPIRRAGHHGMPGPHCCDLLQKNSLAAN